jgi:hypothetical protein
MRPRHLGGGTCNETVVVVANLTHGNLGENRVASGWRRAFFVLEKSV